MTLQALMEQMASCRVCEGRIPEPRPVFRLSAPARILIVGQAPGTRVHATGIPWNDPSGDRLRAWMGLTRDEFYDASRIAILPMGLCYPGKGPSGDLPPRPECAPLWHPPAVEKLGQVELILLVGSYAHEFYLKKPRVKSVTETVRGWKTAGPRYFPIVHPSPRNRRWLTLNPWFEDEVVPALRARVQSTYPTRPPA